MSGRVHRRQEPGRLSARADTIATMLGVLLPARVLVSGLTASVDDGQAGRDARQDFADAFTSEVGEAVPPVAPCSSPSSTTGGSRRSAGGWGGSTD